MPIQTGRKGKKKTTENSSEETELIKCEQARIHTGQSSKNVYTHGVSSFIAPTTGF